MITFFLGSNPALSAQEIISYLKRNAIPHTIESLSYGLLRISTTDKISPEIIKNLGGTIRITEDIISWPHMPSADDILDALSPLPEKWTIGVGCSFMSQNIRRLGIDLKKAARARESRLAFIEPSRGSSVLNAAQVFLHKLTIAPNVDIILQKDNSTFTLTRTIGIQDIASYERRDTSRPVRDTKVGMLPPKLAQIMINLALPEMLPENHIVYDPFCGMGTILQESYLMGLAAYGSDESEKMITASETNLNHIEQYFSINKNIRPRVFVRNVRDNAVPEILAGKQITVVTEPFLGAPQTHALSPTEAKEFVLSVRPLYRTFFVNMHNILPKGSRLLILLPAIRIRENGKETFTPLHRKFLDEVCSIGYRKLQLIPQEEITLYARPDAFVAREITLWEVA